jgi:hypothetical protein
MYQGSLRSTVASMVTSPTDIRAADMKGSDGEGRNDSGTDPEDARKSESLRAPAPSRTTRKTPLAPVAL